MGGDDIDDLKRRLHESLRPKPSDLCECGHERGLHGPLAVMHDDDSTWSLATACQADEDCQCIKFTEVTVVLLPRPS